MRTKYYMTRSFRRSPMMLRISIILLFFAVFAIAEDCAKKPPCQEKGCGFPMCPKGQEETFDERICCCPFCKDKGSADDKKAGS
ncbi:hypothetical protein JTE90_001666 [Oedothorax gibbosus]|uniref:Uncharacterized protein n=1 Tax=Oedothorax gibbosus TaxID=931172 RepID=A0AAV6UVU6_9ARAC|nr:hypothetical protein JTE90_001666 [Oedothorax gibbosus]